MQKNIGTQSWTVFAFDRTTNIPKTGDSAQITAKIQLDDGSRTTSNDANPTEQEDGFYIFDLTQAETDGNKINIYPESGTSNIQVIGVPAVIYTIPPNFQETVISTSGVGNTNIKLISDDATAADNLELDYDGTGYNKTNSTIGTSTANTDMRGTDSAFLAASAPTNFSNLVVSTSGVANSNVKLISDDSVAADNLESQYDLTGLTGDTFPSTQAQVGNIASGTAATNTVATSFTGINPNEPIETLTYANTHALDGVTHDLAPNAGTGFTEGYYEFNVGGNGVPVSVQWEGYANSVGDSYLFYAYNWVGTSWDQVGTKSGLSGSTIVTIQSDLTTVHVGTGANIGLVRFRIYSTGGTTGTNISTDRILCSFSTVFQSVGYANGSIWIDTLLGTSGAVPYVNGTADNPSDNLTDALSLSTALSIRRFQIVSGSTVSLIADATGMVGVGENWNLVLAGQLATNASVIGATITGDANIATTGSELIDCHFDTAGSGVGHTPSTAIRCGLRDEIRLIAAGTYVFKDCYSEVAGTGTPSLDFVAAIGASAVNFRSYSGGIEIKNMAAGDTMSLEGDGQLVINANCSAGTIAIRGNFTITDNVIGGFVAGGGVISDDARFDQTQVLDAVIDDSTRIDATALNTLSGHDPGETIGTADPGDEMALIDDAITASKYDETTAWPIISVDSGSTEIARTGADGDTLETLSDQLDGLPAGIWNLASARGDDFGTLLEQLADWHFNEETVVDLTGGVTLRNKGDSADLATWSITDNDTITVRTEGSWV